MPRIFALLTLLLSAPLCGQVASGGPYTLNKQVIAGGGERASGGSYLLIGTVAQSVTGPVTGGSYSVQQGFLTQTASASQPDAIFKNGFESGAF